MGVIDIAEITQIGAGSFGRVFLADHPLHGRVAVKRLDRGPAESDVAWTARKATLLNEGHLLKAAEHPNIVRVLEVGESPDSNAILLVMELCEMGSAESLYKRGPSPIRRVRRILTGAALGLQAVHSRGMLHRDIKPGNILLASDGGAKLGDFGLVADNLLFGYATGAGYADHLAVEFFQTRRTSVKTDIWAFGMTTYRLLVGQGFYQTNLSRPSFSVPKGGFATHLPWLAHVPAAWRRFVRKAMNDDPDVRFRDATALFTALSALPDEPNWACRYQPDQVHWIRTVDMRKRIVVWNRLSARRHTWSAESVPKGIGRSRKIGGSSGIIGTREVMDQLDAFFEEN